MLSIEFLLFFPLYKTYNEMFLNTIRAGHSVLTSQIFSLIKVKKFPKSFYSNSVSENKQLKMSKTIAIGQMRATNNKEHNRSQVRQIVESAAQQNACVSRRCY